jgi:predicted nucleic acid-binding protein
MLLLDSSVVMALLITEHEYRPTVSRWLAGAGPFAVCPVAQGALTRAVVRLGGTVAEARALLDSLAERPGYEFWPDSLDYRRLDTSGVRGHRQVTDAYLVGLAQSRGARVATLDEGMAQSRPNATELIR